MSVVFPSRVGCRTTDEMDWYVRKFRLESGERDHVQEGDDGNEGTHVNIEATAPARARAGVREEILLMLKLIGMGAGATVLLYLVVLAINS
jgi:hypothetical protein